MVIADKVKHKNKVSHLKDGRVFALLANIV